MTYNKRLFTSESVTEGHPDKIADQVSDAILDEILKDDPNARVACETTVTTGMALISGEISTTTYVDIPKVEKRLKILVILEQNMVMIHKQWQC